jgi:hypothetical protein
LLAYFRPLGLPDRVLSNSLLMFGLLWEMVVDELF